MATAFVVDGFERQLPASKTSAPQHPLGLEPNPSRQPYGRPLRRTRGVCIDADAQSSAGVSLSASTASDRIVSACHRIGSVRPVRHISVWSP